MNDAFEFLRPYLLPMMYSLCGSVLLFLAAIFFYHRKNQRFREMVSRLPAVRCIVIDELGRIRFFRGDGGAEFPANPKTFDDFPEETRRGCGEALREAFRTRRSTQTEYTLCGRRLHIEINYLPKKVFGRESVFWLSTDLDRLYRRSERFAALSERFRLTLCSIDDAVLVTDEKGRVTLANPAAARLLDAADRDLTGALAGDLFRLNSAETGAIPPPVETVLQSGRPVRFVDPLTLTCRSGILRHVVCGASPVAGPAADGRLQGVVLVLRDVAEECDERDRQTESNQLLQQSLSMTGGFSFRCGSPETFLRETPLDPHFWGTGSDGLALPPEKWIYCEDFPGFAAAWGNLFAGKTVSFTQTYRTGSAAPFRTFEMSMRRIAAREPGKILFCGVIREISAKIELERDLARANGLIRALIEAMPHAAALRKIESGAPSSVASNRAYRSLIARDGLDMSVPLDSAVRDFLSAGEIQEIRRVAWTSGTLRNLTGELSLSRFALPDRSEYLFSSFRDLSRETEHEESLSGFNSMFRSAFEHLPGSHVLRDFDDSGRIVLASSAVERYFGRPLASIIGRTSRDLLAPDAADAAELRFRRLLDSGMPESTVENVVCADGSELRCLVFHNPVSGRAGRRLILTSVISLDRLSLLLDRNMPDKAALYMDAFRLFPFPVLLLDADDGLRAVAWNSAMDKLAGDRPVDPLQALAAARNSGDSTLTAQLEIAVAAHRNMILHPSADGFSASVEPVRVEAGHEVFVRVTRSLFEARGRRFLLVTTDDVSTEEDLKSRQRNLIADLENELKNERIVNRLLCRIGVAENDSAQLRSILRTFGSELGADRFFLARFSGVDGSLTSAVEWRGPAAGDAVLFPEPVSCRSSYRHWAERLMHGEKLVFDEFSAGRDLAWVSPESDPLNLLDRGIGSLALFPVIDGSNFVALLGVSYFTQGKRHAFSPADLHLLETVSDLFLTLHRRAETVRQVSENRDRMLRIFDTIHLPMYMFDSAYRIVSVNMEAVKSLGKNRNYLLGKSCCAEVCSSSEPPEWCPAAAVFRTGQPAHYKLNRNGRTFLIDAQGVFDRDGRIVNCIESFHDITEEEKRSRQLEINFRFLNTAAEAAKITYFRCSPELQLFFLGGLRPAGIPDSSESVFAPAWVLPEDRALFHDMFRRVLSSGVPESEVCRSDASGSVASYRTILIPGDSSGEVFGIFQNVTEHRAAEEEKNCLIRQLDSYVNMERLMNDLLTAIIHETDFKTNLNLILDDVFRLSGCDRIDFGCFSDDGADFYPMAERQSSALTTSVLFRDPLILRHVPRTIRLLSGDDEILRLEALHSKLRAYFVRVTGCSSMIAVPVKSAGRLFGVLALGFRESGRGASPLDETVLRSAAQIVSLAREQENKQKLISKFDLERRMIFDNIKIPFLFFEKRNRLTRVNPAVCKIFGIEPCEIEGKPCGRIFCRENTDLPFCPVERAFETGFPQSHNVTLAGREYILNAEPILNTDGTIRHVVETATDVTEINESSRQLEKALAAAQSAERAKSYFLATMSHELRTPLNAVIGFSELLLHTKAEAHEHQEYLNSINVAGNALLRLINDVLDLSKLEADQMPISPAKSDFSVFLKELDTIFRHRAGEKNLYLRFVLPENLPLLYVDIARFRHVMFNIIGNAVKFTDHGGITVTAEFTPADSTHGSLAVSVADTGAGVDEHIQEHIFDPFVQQETVRGRRNTEGTGLGLAISKRMAERMKGELTLESEPGRGSVFTIRIPRVRFEKPGLSAPEKTVVKAAAPVPEGMLDILLVDDVPVNLKVLEAHLRRFPCRVRSAFSATEAIELFDARRCHVVLTDLRMPDKDGWTLAGELKKRAPDPASLRIWIITASGPDSENLHPEWVEGVLQKPVSSQALRDLLFPAETPVIADQNHIANPLDQTQGNTEL